MISYDDITRENIKEQNPNSLQFLIIYTEY